MCVFCKIVSNEIPSYKIYEDELFLAFLDISQTTKGHTLVIPKQHYEDFLDLEDAFAGKLYSLTSKLTKHICKQLKVKDVNVLTNTGSKAGQTVMHCHIHIIPRYEKDSFAISFSQNETKEKDFLDLKNELSYPDQS